MIKHRKDSNLLLEAYNTVNEADLEKRVNDFEVGLTKITEDIERIIKRHETLNEFTGMGRRAMDRVAGVGAGMGARIGNIGRVLKAPFTGKLDLKDPKKAGALKKAQRVLNRFNTDLGKLLPNMPQDFPEVQKAVDSLNKSVGGQSTASQSWQQTQTPAAGAQPQSTADRATAQQAAGADAAAQAQPELAPRNDDPMANADTGTSDATEEPAAPEAEPEQQAAVEEPAAPEQPAAPEVEPEQPATPEPDLAAAAGGAEAEDLANQYTEPTPGGEESEGMQKTRQDHNYPPSTADQQAAAADAADPLKVAQVPTIGPDGQSVTKTDHRDPSEVRAQDVADAENIQAGLGGDKPGEEFDKGATDAVYDSEAQPEPVGSPHYTPEEIKAHQDAGGKFNKNTGKKGLTRAQKDRKNELARARTAKKKETAAKRSAAGKKGHQTRLQNQAARGELTSKKTGKAYSTNPKAVASRKRRGTGEFAGTLNASYNPLAANIGFMRNRYGADRG